MTVLEINSQTYISKFYGIKPLLAEPPIREGTNRYRNMFVVLRSRTVGEALDRLKKLESKGGMKDIRLAVKNKPIELINAENVAEQQAEQQYASIDEHIRK